MKKYRKALVVVAGLGLAFFLSVGVFNAVRGTEAGSFSRDYLAPVEIDVRFIDRGLITLDGLQVSDDGRMWMRYHSSVWVIIGGPSVVPVGPGDMVVFHIVKNSIGADVTYDLCDEYDRTDCELRGALVGAMSRYHLAQIEESGKETAVPIPGYIAED